MNQLILHTILTSLIPPPGSPQPKLALLSPDQLDLSPYLTVQEERLALKVEEVTREMAGKYTCTADNGFDSTPTSREMTVYVEYPPEVEISESFILTDLAGIGGLAAATSGLGYGTFP